MQSKFAMFEFNVKKIFRKCNKRFYKTVRQKKKENGKRSSLIKGINIYESEII